MTVGYEENYVNDFCTGERRNSGSSCEILSCYSATLMGCSACSHPLVPSAFTPEAQASDLCRVGTSGRCREDIHKCTECTAWTLVPCKSSWSVQSHCSVAHNSCANTFSSKNRWLMYLSCRCVSVSAQPRTRKTSVLYWSAVCAGCRCEPIPRRKSGIHKLYAGQMNLM